MSQTGRTIKEDAFIETFRSMAIESLFTLSRVDSVVILGKQKVLQEGALIACNRINRKYLGETKSQRLSLLLTCSLYYLPQKRIKIPLLIPIQFKRSGRRRRGEETSISATNCVETLRNEQKPSPIDTRLVTTIKGLVLFIAGD